MLIILWSWAVNFLLSIWWLNWPNLKIVHLRNSLICKSLSNRFSRSSISSWVSFKIWVILWLYSVLNWYTLLIVPLFWFSSYFRYYWWKICWGLIHNLVLFLGSSRLSFTQIDYLLGFLLFRSYISFKLHEFLICRI